MKAVYVCGTDTDVGKSVLSALLLRHLQRQGISARYLKPLQTGPDSDTAMVQRLAEISKQRIAPPVVSLPRPASVDQAAADAGVSVLLHEVRKSLTEIMAGAPNDFWVLEAAGGLRVPLNDKEEQVDLIQSVGAPVILAARSGLGTLNHTLLTVEALERRRIPLHGVVMFGEPHPENVGSLSKRLGAVPILDFPWFKELNPEALDLALGVHDFGVLFP